MKDGHTECPTCRKVLNSKAKLVDHIRRMHTKDAKPFKCDRCEYREYNISAVKKHMLICKPQSCPHCEMSLGNKRLLDEHKRALHENEKIKCPHCDYASKNSGHVYRHVRLKHKLEMRP